MKISCDEVRRKLHLVQDGESEGEDQNQVREHLDRCARCLREYEAELELDGLLSGLPKPTCPERVVRAIEEDIRRRAERGSPWIRIRKHLADRRWVPVPVGLAVIVLVALLLLRHPGRAPGSGTADYTDDQIERAGKEARWALSYVVQTIEEKGVRTTGDFVESELPHMIRNHLERSVPEIEGDGQ